MHYLIQAEIDGELPIPVREHHMQLRLAPLDDSSQRVLSTEMHLEPEGFFTRHRDGFGNALDCCGVMSPHQRVALRMRSEVQTLLENPFEFPLVPPKRERDWLRHALTEAPRLWDFVLHRSTRVPDLAALEMWPKRLVLREGVALMDQVTEAMSWIGDQLDLDLSCPSASDRVETVLESRCASCADMAHLLIAVLRSAGLPARFATGFVDPDFFAADPSEPGSEDMPQTLWAWAEVLIPGAGWRGFDPAAGLVVNDHYVRVAVGRDAGDVRYLKESFKGDAPRCTESLTVRVDVVDQGGDIAPVECDQVEEKAED